MLTALTAAADVSGLSDAAETVLVAGIAIAVGFAGYKVIKRALGRA